ncbi:uncharacterized protein Dana_GF27981 [Drosophila ananassae]|uniref:Mab-21-like HhH/H2TH-like domain-containing protein n=2 Tax=Drosophila ananassae TaxID=7217 RepID=A0A0P9AL31_DROAN|nr:uncharacterized protein Dana_GF27981 [Drosophila ananassae]
MVKERKDGKPKVPKGILDEYEMYIKHMSQHLMSNFELDHPLNITKNIVDDTYNIHIKVEFPFKLTPKRDEMRSGFVFLCADEKVDHPAVVDGYLDRLALVHWVKQKILMPLGSNQLIHVPVVEFDYSQFPKEYLPSKECGLLHHTWYAVPIITTPLDRRSFMVWAPDWERCVMDSHPQSRALSCLLKTLCLERFKDENHMDKLIRSLLLHEIPKLPRDLGASLMHLLETLVKRLSMGRLPPILVDNVNLLSMDMESLEKFHDTLKSLLKYLRCHIEKANEFPNDKTDPNASFLQDDKEKKDEKKYNSEDEEEDEVDHKVEDDILLWHKYLEIMFGLKPDPSPYRNKGISHKKNYFHNK